MESLNNVPIKIDVKANSKDAANVINKLIDTIKAPFSWWAKGKEPVLQAQAEVDAMLIRARSIEPLAEALGVTKEEATSLVLRSEQREQLEKIRQQKNIETIVQTAVEMLPHNASEKPVDEDWTTEFLESCKNVTNEEMQSIWARILAGEVVEPGTFNKRTLAFVKTLSPQEAALFTKFCGLLWNDPYHGLIHITLNNDELAKNFGISYLDIVELESLGLIRFDTNTAVNWEAPGVPLIYYYGEPFYFYPKQQNGKITINVFPLTKLGSSIVKIAGGTRNVEYMSAVFETIKSKNVILCDKPPRG